MTQRGSGIATASATSPTASARPSHEFSTKPRSGVSTMTFIRTQERLERDPNILKTLAKHNRIDVAGGGLYPCAGVYAVVASPGALRKGDRVAVT